MDTPKPVANMPNALLSPADLPNDPSGYSQDALSSTEAAKMAGWAKEDLAAGKITQPQADLIFDQLGLPPDMRGWQPDTRNREQQQLDQHMPAAKPQDYLIQYDRPGTPPLDPLQQQKDHTRGAGIELFRLACQLDLEGIVAKRADSPYEDNANDPHWIKIKNAAYTQKEGRGTCSSGPDSGFFLLVLILGHGDY